MKHSLFIALSTALFSFNSFAATAQPKSKVITIADVNAAIVQVLAPLQNEATKANVIFSNIVTTATRTQSFKVGALYSKIGKKGKFAIVADEISYDYGQAGTPTTVIKGGLKGDLTLIATQEELNPIFDDLETWVGKFASELTSKYGEGVTVKTAVQNKIKDANGNVVSLEAKLDYALDFKKTPNSVKIEDEAISGASASFKLSVKEGASIDARVISNLKYKAFDKDQIGMKEYLEKFMALDQNLLQGLAISLGYIDNYVTDFLK